MFKSTIDIQFSDREVPCNADVLLWNYWDGEHLLPVHGGYKSAFILYQGETFSLCLFKAKPPYLPFSIPTLAFVIQHKQYKQLTYALQIFLLSKTTIRIRPINTQLCTVSVRYQMIVPRIFACITPFLSKLIPKWFETVFKEDLPLRIRRQRVLNAGFIDYKGMPHWSGNSGHYSYHFKHPLIPSKGSPLLDHTYYESCV